MAVSDGDEDVKPVCGHKKPKKDSDNKDDPIKGLIQTAQAHTESQEKHEAEKLKTEQAVYALALRCEEREARLAEECWQLEKEVREQEEEQRKDAAKCEACERAERMMNSKSAIIQAKKGEQLAKELVKEEGIEV